MNCLIVFRKDTGDVVAFKSPFDDQAVDTESLGSLIADVDPNDTSFYVKNKQIEKRPDRPKDYYVWDGSDWVPDTDRAAIEARLKRDSLLMQSDWTELQGAQSRLGINLYKQWQDYRQALRDISKQVGFPLNIIWPTPPA